MSTAQVSVLSRGNHLRILNLEYSRVTKGYECLKHCMSLLVTCEIMRARATLHLSGTVHEVTMLCVCVFTDYSCGSFLFFVKMYFISFYHKPQVCILISQPSCMDSSVISVVNRPPKG